MKADGEQKASPGLPPGRALSIAALCLALVGVVLFPPGGLTAVVCGALAWSRGDRKLGAVSIVAGVVSFFASFFVAAKVLS
jgi:hypothetical protein